MASLDALDSFMFCEAFAVTCAAISDGGWSACTSSHGPSVVQARNQRSTTRTYTSSSVGSLKTVAVVLTRRFNDVPRIGSYRGARSVKSGRPPLLKRGLPADQPEACVPGRRTISTIRHLPPPILHRSVRRR